MGHSLALYMSVALETLWLVICSAPDMIASIYYLVVPRPCKDVASEIVMVTGAGQGIGRALSLRFAQLGSKLLCVDLNPEDNLETVRIIRESGGKATGYTCDVSDRKAVVQLAEEVGRVDILINNAGIYPFGASLWTSTEEGIRKIIDTNLLSQFWTTQAFLPGMKDRDHGHVVSISSTAGITGVPYMVPYTVSKAGLTALMLSLKQEIFVEKKNIKLTRVYPFTVNTKEAIRITRDLRLRLPGLDLDYTANQITVGIRQDLEAFTVPRVFTLFTMLIGILPASFGDKWLYNFIYWDKK